MSNLRSVVSNRVRVVLALSIALANLSLFAISSSAAPRGCFNCVELPGGALGTHVECDLVDEGSMGTCTPGLLECFGYPCIWNEAAPQAEIEVIPPQVTAPAN